MTSQGRLSGFVLGLLVVAACGGSTSEETAPLAASTGGASAAGAGGGSAVTTGGAGGSTDTGGSSSGGASAEGGASSAGAGGDTSAGGSGGTAGGSSGASGQGPAGSSTGGSTSLGGAPNGGMAPWPMGGPTLDPGVISKSTKSLIESETHLAVGPNGLVAASWIAIMGTGFSTMGYRFSSDDGQTWAAVDAIQTPTGPNGGRVASDPVMAFDAAGNCYMTWIGFTEPTSAGAQPTDMAVFVSTAPAGTGKFETPVQIDGDATGSYDKPWITVTDKGTILVTYANIGTGQIFAATSHDGNKTWSKTPIAQGNFRNLVYPCIAPDNWRVWATYHAGGGIGIRWSDDDGATFPDANKTAVAEQNGMTPAFDDPTCVASGNDVWVAYGYSPDQFTSAINPKLTSIVVAHSTDGGVSFADHYEALDKAAGTYAMHPQLGRDPLGNLYLVYYSGHMDKDPMGSYRWSKSTDGGKTWMPSQAVHAPVTMLTDRASPSWLGDYTGLAIANGNLYTSYVQNQGNVQGYAHVAFFRTAIPLRGKERRRRHPPPHIDGSPVPVK